MFELLRRLLNPRGRNSIGSKAPNPEDCELDLSYEKETLGKWVLEDDPNNELKNYLDADFLRFIHTLNLVPNEKGKLLELGSGPYFATRLLQWHRQYELELANYFDPDGGDEITQKAKHSESGEEEIFTSKLFNTETSVFPYGTGAFDVVLYCEILEHLTEDPVAALAEINRVLKPGGHLILTTPNVARLQNVMRILSGQNIYDPYSGYGPYGRHNREYTIGEAQHILATNGFEIELGYTASITEEGLKLGKKMIGHVFKLLVGRSNDLGEYIFIRAKKVAECPKKRTPHFYRSRADIQFD